VRSAAAYVLVALLSGLAGFAAVYVTWGRPDNAKPASAAPVAAREEPAPVAAPRPGIHPLSTGEMTAFRFHAAPRGLASVRFVDASGAPRSLSDWRGKIVLLNLWATWCAPCRKEMPALDRLQKSLGSEGFEVVALNLDRGGVETAKKFLDQIKIEALKLYADPSTRASNELNAVGMPTTILIDRDGRELGRIVGPAEWDSADAQRLIAASLR
jgi:thiol-disulfide isomerase/thioredoxin